VADAENLLIFGSDVCNAFAKAPPPKQGFYIRPDRAFTEWWENYKGNPPIPPGHVIPVLSAMQGHPESPRLWEKHANAILHDIGLTPTVHEPCLYSGVINGKRIVFMRQVDNFAIGAPDQHTADILLDLLDEHLTMPIKRQGLLDMFNGFDVAQTKYYIKIDCHTNRSGGARKVPLEVLHLILRYYSRLAISTDSYVKVFFCFARIT
jgi:hypothetical protein